MSRARRNMATSATPLWAGRGPWMIVGWIAIGFPALYLTVTAWDSGEHANIPIAIGLLASACQGAIWAVAWHVVRHTDTANRPLMFGAGAPLSLIGLITVFAATQSSVAPYTSLALAVATYLLVVVLTVWATKKFGGEQ